MIKQHQVSLKPWILWLCSKPSRQIWRVSGELSILQSSVVCHFHNLSKSIQSFQIVLHVTKILQNFWLTFIKFLIWIKEFIMFFIFLYDLFQCAYIYIYIYYWFFYDLDYALLFSSQKPNITVPESFPWPVSRMRHIWPW